MPAVGRGAPLRYPVKPVRSRSLLHAVAKMAESNRRRMGIRRRSAILSIATLLHLHQATVERGPAALVGETLGGEGVDVAGVRRFLGPPGGGGGHHARRHAAIAFTAQRAGTAVMEQP